MYKKELLLYFYFRQEDTSLLLPEASSNSEETYEPYDAENCEGVSVAQPTPKKYAFLCLRTGVLTFLATRTTQISVRSI